MRFAVTYVADQVCQFSASYSGGVERHQPECDDKESELHVDEVVATILLAEDRWQVNRPSSGRGVSVMLQAFLSVLT